MKKYLPSEIESKWQKIWADEKIYSSHLENEASKFYVLAEFAYPSGDLHMGHWFTFSGADIYARVKRMQGYNVFFPNGFDAFGLPAENAAIKRNIHPQDWTMSNIEKMKEQYATLGASFSFDHEVITCLPNYYKWNQWAFLKMLEKGIAYRGSSLANWCPVDNTVLADEQVINGHCDRCGAEVTKKEIPQWFLKITEYADRLEWKEDGNGVDWPKATMDGQNNWIGKSLGAVLKFDSIESDKDPIEVFTTRIDTIFGVTFLVISPEHPLLNSYLTEAQSSEVQSYIESAKKKSELERKENKDKTGVFTGGYVKNPFNDEKIPVWVADYVLMSYGTGAIMAVPAHDDRDYEFAKKFDLKIKHVIKPEDGDLDQSGIYKGEGILINSQDYDGLKTSQARENLSKYIEEHQIGDSKINFHLHDWSISRQRYWGTPIPIIHCEDCGAVPVPYEQLPVELPFITDFTPKGKPPLATAEKWVNVNCPNCNKPAKRDTDTMDGFVDNSWYFFRYLDPQNDKEIFSQDLASKWLPVNIYFGGAEHTLGHTMYSRFFSKFYKDLGLVDFEEYSLRRVNHGIILGPDGSKMSKSRGNVVNPDEMVKEFGADAIRLYLAFIGPYEEIVSAWNSSNVNGVYHFLQRVWALSDKVKETALSPIDLKIMHRTIKKVTEEVESIKFNTAVASLMEWLNYLSKKGSVTIEEYKNLILMLAPFAPHITEELWHSLGDNSSVHQHSWPEFDNKFLEEEELTIVIQVNGKVREKLMISKDIVSNKEDIVKMALEKQRIKDLTNNGASVKNSVYITGRVLNLVV